MKFRLDHLVIAVHDLARAVEDYRALGFTVVPGGRHPGRTSHNALVAFEDGSYLELIAWYEPGPSERWYKELSSHGEGLMDFALLPESVPRAITEAKARGLKLEGPIDGGRARPDGEQVQWQTARQGSFDLPFLCGDVTPRELRVPTGEARRHANGALGISQVAVAANDPGTSAARYAALLGVPASATRFTLGATTLSLLPDPDAEPSHFLAAAKQRLALRGEGPCAFALQTRNAKPPVLDGTRTHGVRIEVTR